MSDLIHMPQDAIEVIELDERLDMSLDSMMLVAEGLQVVCSNKQYCMNCVAGCACS